MPSERFYVLRVGVSGFKRSSGFKYITMSRTEAAFNLLIHFSSSSR